MYNSTIVHALPAAWIGVCNGLSILQIIQLWYKCTIIQLCMSYLQHGLECAIV